MSQPAARPMIYLSPGIALNTYRVWDPEAGVVKIESNLRFQEDTFPAARLDDREYRKLFGDSQRVLIQLSEIGNPDAPMEASTLSDPERSQGQISLLQDDSLNSPDLAASVSTRARRKRARSAKKSRQSQNQSEDTDSPEEEIYDSIEVAGPHSSSERTTALPITSNRIISRERWPPELHFTKVMFLRVTDRPQTVAIQREKDGKRL
ncbi:hypothetical protein BJ508DRAFT_314415 [Ascobolus immersus RN42]|uniref:Uncharacterized protein n=1 Tax=Ascobolus immersus RN42 TaxID=1160509 RepID=A0A3N4HF51_ASCIM|nr:hypothetical protein BJ508DRAFT_314415 [Ascobolus immersus RN42]